ncbi:tetratricopeptide repeat protein [Natronoglycomyces albus]|uniref:Uncharacterized protein n=1 Tax=Natronoglycomyces albus TaxID=2811108 RepID=A0A895XR79_9ACTN|nr:hypothetical protein [Natronoglycomyces albus]QSB05066.1 hypothetical protein JQS30_15105 [Natronoglycomyces albus]
MTEPPESSLDHWEEQLSWAKKSQGRWHAEMTMSQRMSVVVRIEADIEKYLLDHPNDLRARYLYARAASQRKNWDVALVRWRELVGEESDFRDEAWIELSRAHRMLGNPIQAFNSLRNVSPRRQRLRSYTNEESRVRELSNAILHTQVGDRFIAGLKAGVSRSDLGDRAKFVLETRGARDGDPGPLSRLLTGMVSMSWAQRRALRRRNSRLDTLPQSQSRFVCGMGWSGSGALFDYIVQSPMVSTPFGRIEAKLFSGRGDSVSDIAAQCEREQFVERDRLVDMILRCVAGVGTRPYMAPLKVAEGSLLSLLKDSATDVNTLVDRTLHFYHRLAGLPKEIDSRMLEDLFCDYYGGLFSGIGNRSLNFYNNIVHGHASWQLRFVPGARATVVIRDPRDQYVARQREQDSTKRMSVDRFISAQKSNNARLEQAQADSRIADRIDIVQFERLVLDEGYRDQIVSSLGIDPETVDPGEKGYKPGDSAHNVGLFKDFPNRDAIRRIEDEMSEYLYL